MAVKSISTEAKHGVGPQESDVRTPAPVFTSRNHSDATHLLIIHLPTQNNQDTRDLIHDQLHNNIIRVRIPGDDHDLTLTWHAFAMSRTFIIFRARTQWDALYVQRMTELRLRTLRPATGPLRYAVTRILGSFIEM